MAQENASSEAEPDRLPGSVLRLLAPERRRAIVHALLEEPNATHRVEDLAEAIRESHEHAVDSNPAYLRASLHHTHLPKLDDAEFVDYDPQNGTIQYEGDPAVEEWVDQIERIDQD